MYLEAMPMEQDFARTSCSSISVIFMLISFFFFVVDFFHSETATWSIVQPLVDGDQPAPRRKHDSVVVGDKLYVFGGKGATNYFNDLWVFDFGTT